ncbi:MAG: FtsQ-type POTRA domain-containing protein [Proteobacteria bacterium]|nr:FtsQ-type POTRA domain-containing protein [Pseudomonadota bacterium]
MQPPQKKKTIVVRGNRYVGAALAKSTARTGLRRMIGAVLHTGKILFSGFFLLFTLGLLSAGLVFAYHYLLHSPTFMVRKVIVSGLERVSQTEVLERTGLDRPSNILALRLAESAEHLEAHPWIERVTVTRRFPETVLVDIRERRTVALINLGTLYYLDENGRAICRVGVKENPELPIITGFSREDLIERERFTQRDMRSVFALLQVLAGRNDRFRVENISEINFDPVRGLSLFTREDDVCVKIGFGDFQGKLKRLGRVLAQLKIKGQDAGLTYFNLECSPRVIVRRTAEG